jgi:hypothetical protein
VTKIFDRRRHAVTAAGARRRAPPFCTARVQSREYVLRATGWVRTVAGIQSLLSVYLLALWVLTYFGRPFE